MAEVEASGFGEVDPANEPRLLVIGAGAVLQEQFTPAILDKLAPRENRIIIDIDSYRLSAMGIEERGTPLRADAMEGLPPELQSDELARDIALVITPDHLGPISALVESGVRNFIVEKPLVNNSEEVKELTQLLEQNPDIKIYPMDFYIQKAAPLLVLTGTITPEDPRFSWVTTANGQELDPELSGSFDGLIGDLDGIEATVFEGGSLGVPNLDRRKWLETDTLRGGMLLDLGTHAITPLMAAGVILHETVKVENATRKALGTDRESFVRIAAGQVESYAHALLTAERQGRRIPCLMTVGKTFHDGGLWKTSIRGTAGDISMGLRTGQRLTVEPKENEAFQLRLKENDPYSLAFQEAKMYFDGFPGFDGNLDAMMATIGIIDEIKSVADAG